MRTVIDNVLSWHSIINHRICEEGGCVMDILTGRCFAHVSSLRSLLRTTSYSSCLDRAGPPITGDFRDEVLRRSRDEKDGAAVRLWVKIFTATFAIGVATGITMEFSFGTNWADYSRFVGDIFGAPLAAEALFAFFLESVFLGVLLFGRNKVSRKFYTVSAWLVWAGSLLSASGSSSLTRGCRRPPAPSSQPMGRRLSSPTSSQQP